MTGLAFGTVQLALEPRPDEMVFLDVDVVADLAITVDGIVLFEEPGFPVVDLAAALAKWLPDARSPEPQAFRYTSIEAEETPLIAFEPEDDGWFLRSPWQRSDQQRPLLITEVASAAGDFVGRVASAVDSDLGIDIGRRLTAEPGEIDVWKIHRSALTAISRNHD